MIRIYQLKRYFWSIFGVLGVVLFWAGVWDGIGYLPWFHNPLVCLLVGFVILGASGILFKEFDPLGMSEKKKILSLHHVYSHPQRHQFSIKYYDHIKRSNITISAKKLRKIENEAFLNIEEAGKEVFIPIHRIKEIFRNGKKWTLSKK